MTQSNETPLGNQKVRLFLPSRRQDGAVLAGELREDWKAKAQRKLEQLFGGCNAEAPTVGPLCQ